MKLDKKKAFSAFKAALKRTSFTVIFTGATNFAHDPNLPEPKYIKHAATWLNGDCWLNAPQPRAPNGFTTKNERAQAEWDEDRRIREELQAQEGDGRLAIGG